jgi:hypothetical protein
MRMDSSFLDKHFALCPLDPIDLNAATQLSAGSCKTIVICTLLRRESRSFSFVEEYQVQGPAGKTDISTLVLTLKPSEFLVGYN